MVYDYEPFSATWDEFVAGFKPLQENGITPIAIPAKVWAHAEWFESLLIRTAGVTCRDEFVAVAADEHWDEASSLSPVRATKSLSSTG